MSSNSKVVVMAKRIYEILADWIKKREAGGGCHWVKLCQALSVTAAKRSASKGFDWS
jgi:hypothetical protein